MNDQKNGETCGFFPLVFRQKYIHRWGLMRNAECETLSEHAMEVAVIAHALALIGNKLFGGQYDPERIALLALYHDVPEVYTGDLPTPVKYFDEGSKVPSARRSGGGYAPCSASRFPAGGLPTAFRGRQRERA